MGWKSVLTYFVGVILNYRIPSEILKNKKIKRLVVVSVDSKKQIVKSDYVLCQALNSFL